MVCSVGVAVAVAVRVGLGVAVWLGVAVEVGVGVGVCFLDPQEAAAERLLRAVPPERFRDVILWDPTDRERPFGLSPFWWPDHEEIASKADNFIAALASLEEFASVFAGGPHCARHAQPRQAAP